VETFEKKFTLKVTSGQITDVKRFAPNAFLVLNNANTITINTF
jgi:hypothetical protein